MGSQSVNCHPTQVNTPRLNPSHVCWYSIYLPRRDGTAFSPDHTPTRPHLQWGVGHPVHITWSPATRPSLLFSVNAQYVLESKRWGSIENKKISWGGMGIGADFHWRVTLHCMSYIFVFVNVWKGNRRSGTSNKPWWGCVKILLRVLAFPARMLGITMVWDLESRGPPVYLLPEKWLLCAIPDISGMGCEIFHVGIIANLGYAEESRICSTTQRHAVSWFILFNMDAEKFEHRTLYARLILSNSWAICLFLSCWDDTEYNVCNVYN